ncbi:MAG: hypothetical protein NWE89_01625 [Candidatus Bathyarchaeota archaeon]|nr:hypothetical protein [Candidatus Bathyarchaeota archaeon]
MSVEEEFIITFDATREKAEATLTGETLGFSLYEFIRKGKKRLLNFSTKRLVDAADILKKGLRDATNVEWEVDNMTLTISATPSVTLTLATKKGES